MDMWITGNDPVTHIPTAATTAIVADRKEPSLSAIPYKYIRMNP
jgi:hypothetical protein